MSRGTWPGRLAIALVVVVALAGGFLLLRPSRPAEPATARAALPGLGVDVHLEGLTDQDRRAEFARLAAMGATWVRLGAPWYAIQPDSPAVDPAALGELVRTVSEAASAGLNVLLVGGQAPDWAGGGSATASRPDAYGAFMGAVAERFRDRAAGGPNPRAIAYELMNEPDGEQEDGRRWATPEDYAAAACSAFHAIKAADPAATVLAGSLDVTDWSDWLRSALRSGLTGCFDALSAHPYSGPGVLTEIREAAAEAGRPGVDVWVTEFGHSTCADVLDGCVSQTEQASLLVAGLGALGRDYPWVPVAMVYVARDEPENPRDGRERHFGLFGAAAPGTEPVPKPAVAAIRELYLGPEPGGR